MYTVLDAIATATPPYTRPQSEAAAFMQRVEGTPEGLRRRLPMIYEASAIERRYSCVSDFLYDDPDQFTFYPKNWQLDPQPTTAERNQQYRRHVLQMAEEAAAEALEASGVAPEAITHVIAVTCTGFFAPGLDIELVKRLGLRPETERTVIGFMGCYAAFNALRVAHGFCQSRPDARVLVVCAELCTLHFQVPQTLEQAVVYALFSDGCAAAVLSSRSEEEARGELAYVDSACVLDDDSMDYMTWDIGDTGFDMTLSARVPRVIARNLPAYLDGLLGRHGLETGDLDFWAIHPGGKAIVDAARDVMELADDDVADSLEVLRAYGNMSSPTILFVLKRFLDRHRAGTETFRHGVALAFGPGLTLEGNLWKVVE